MLKLLLIMAFLSAGYISKRVGWCKPQYAMSLNQIIIYLPLPAVVLLKIPFLKVDQSLLLPILTPWLLLSPVLLLLLLLKPHFNWNRQEFGCLMICCILGNTAYLGYPMTSVLLGEQALATAIIYDQLGNFLLLAIFTSLVIAWSNSDQNKNPAVEICKRIFSFPPFLTLLIALFIPQQLISGLTLNFLELIALSLMPLAMFSIGLQLDLKPASNILQPMLIGLSIKMLFMPLLVFIAITLIGNWDLQQKVVLLQSAMPPSVAAGALAISARLAPRLCASLVAYGMLLSMIILPMWAWLIP